MKTPALLLAILLFSAGIFAQSDQKVLFHVSPDTVANSSSLDTIPNVFSPNNDGINDVFRIEGAGLSDFKLSIFNRWGTLVYDFISAGDAWDGRNTSGEACSSGTYFYFFKASGVDGKSYDAKGCIQLFR
jgi:gliding motility-associated-like protein